MTKPMDVVLKVEKGMLGEVIDKLDGMPGVAEIGLKLRGPTEKKAKTKAVNRPDSEDVVLTMLQAGPANIRDLRAGFEHVGYHNSTAYATIRKMCEKGSIEPFPNRADVYRLAKGHHPKVKHEPRAALPAPAKKKSSFKRPAGGQMNDVLLTKMHEMNGAGVARAILKDTAVKAGFKPKGVDARIFDLRKNGYIKVSEPGVYELTAKGRQWQPTQGEVSNG